MNEIEALAEAKAIRNGDIARFRIERHGACELFGSTGTYERYMMEAEEALESGIRSADDIRAILSNRPTEKLDWSALYESAEKFS